MGKPSQAQALTRMIVTSAVSLWPNQGCTQSPSPTRFSPWPTAPHVGLSSMRQRKPTTTSDSVCGRK